MTSERHVWDFWIDRGGTFTDVVARDPDGQLHVHKLLSEDPEHYDDAPLEAIRRLLDVPRGKRIPSEKIASVKMGTTLATNALLERKGARVGLLVTRGFHDLLEIGYQDRPDLFALNIKKPSSLAERIEAIDERILTGGDVRTPIDEDQVERILKEFAMDDIESVAVLFLNSYANPEHENIAGRIAEQFGFRQVSLSHRVANEIKAVPRGDTTMVDAYLTPIMRDYVARLRDELGPDVLLRFMQSDGGLVRVEHFSGKDAILSGPAGGVVAYGSIAEMAALDEDAFIGFDMGGTSTDVSRCHNGPELTYERRIAGVRLKAPMIAIETVAAGGGSILAFQNGRFTVGPESAGANPGPACYGRGGPATVTDANLVLGRIQPDYFPKVFGPNADEKLNTKAARKAIDEIRKDVERYTDRQWTPEEVAAGFIRIANENMVKPIKEISVAKGYDVQEHALVTFGGAGGQHACAIADALGMETILISPYAGVLSALGMGYAKVIKEFTEPALHELNQVNLDEAIPRIEQRMDECRDYLAGEGFTREKISFRLGAEVRYAGTDSALTLDMKVLSEDTRRMLDESMKDPTKKLSRERFHEVWATAEFTRQNFEKAHRNRYGFHKPSTPIEVVNYRVIGYGYPDGWPSINQPVTVEDGDGVFTAQIHLAIERTNQAGATVLDKIECPLYRLESLEQHIALKGPAIVMMDTSTTVVDKGWKVTRAMDDVLELKRTHIGFADRPNHVSTERDPVMLEVFNNLFMSIADQMGKRLENVAHSVNIKERLDFSCALFTAEGDLVANAHHIPVHLGAMSESVKAVLAEHGDIMRPGDVFVTNDPYNGGSHLPDVTVVTPMFDDVGERLFIVANRGHHADIGGITPGSMPPHSATLDEEGVVLSNVRLVHEGTFDEEGITSILSSGPYPARNIQERLSDLRAQIAANTFGVQLLEELCTKCGRDVVAAYMDHMRANAAECMEAVLRELGDGEYMFEDHVDNGAKIAVKITINKDQATIDFTGTDPQLPGNLNAPHAVVVSACLYVLRTLIGKPIPLNSGCLDPIDIIIPKGSLLDPHPPAAVVGGNVETSQRIVDVLYGALESVAASEGTMNNLTFGTPDWGYYETICGGTGAGPDFHGANAVHCHMTNTRITDPEVFERRYPVVLREFTLRQGSGGAGAHTGGEGVRRAIEFLEPVEVSMLSERRATAPYGLKGGQPGAPGRNILQRANGETIELDGHFAIHANPGDILIIETPGGGGYGEAPQSFD